MKVSRNDITAGTSVRCQDQDKWTLSPQRSWKLHQLRRAARKVEPHFFPQKEEEEKRLLGKIETKEMLKRRK